MKTNNTMTRNTLLVTAILMTGLTQADQISASFERDMSRQPTLSSETTLKREHNLPEQDAVNRIIRDNDPVKESFDRDLNHEPIKGSYPRVSGTESDPVQILIRKALLR